MKKPTKPTAPATLFESAMAVENKRHAYRLAELKRLQKKLALLDAFTPAIEAAGLSIAPSEINSWGGKTIYLSSRIFDHRHNAKLAAVLIEQGMHEVGRRDYSTGNYTLELMKGYLRLSISIDGRGVAAAAPGDAACA